MFRVRQFLPLCTNCFRRSHRNILQIRPLSTEKGNIDYDDGPIKYSTSGASKYKAKSTRTGIEEERLWYEPYVLMVSLSIFLLYFCVIREENDIDKELGTSLYSRIEGLEEHQLRLSLRYNMEKGLDTKDIRHRLEQIEREKETFQTANSE